MTTEAQNAANRRNAEQSTGPRTAAGKQRVSRNAITHGLDCAALLLPGEDVTALAAYRAAMIADHQPVGAEEQDLVERMVAAHWRVCRMWQAEADVYANQRHRRGEQAWIGSCVLGDLQEERGLAYLDRKEAQLTREYHRCSQRLLALQDLRRKGLRHVLEEAAAPLGESTSEAAAVYAAAPADETAPAESPEPIVDAAFVATDSSRTASGEIAEQTQSPATSPVAPSAETAPMAASAPESLPDAPEDAALKSAA